MADQHLKTRDDGSITDCVSVVENENHRHRELPRHLDRAERSVRGRFLHVPGSLASG